MSDRVLLQLNEMPGVIRESARAVLKAHGYRICRPSSADGVYRILDEREHESLLNELGRNTSQALYSIDESERFDIAVSDETLDAIDSELDREDAEGRTP